MALTGIRFDDGSGGFATNCFPVRTLSTQNEEAYGAWLVAHRAEQRRRFKAFLCSKPRTFEDIRNERKRADHEGVDNIVPPADDLTKGRNLDENRVLDGFFLMKHCCVDDPVDLCSVNVSAQGLTDVNEEDLQLFDSVAYVNASENILPLEPFNSFQIIRELELSLNGLRGLDIKATDFPCLEMLDLSFNNLSTEDISSLGLLPQLRVLHLTGNGLQAVPSDIGQPVSNQDQMSIPRFKHLEILLLDDNKLCDSSVFAALAGLQRLKHLNLSKNGITAVPQLLLMEGRHVPQKSETPTKYKRTRIQSSRSSIKSAVRKSTAGAEKDTKLSDIDDREKISHGNRLDSVDPEHDHEQTVAAREEAVAGTEGTSTDWQPHLPPPPPFPQLQHLNLSHNKISAEEDLLPVAAWPRINELVLHDNPLTTTRSGDPPILKHFLTDRLGIHIQRKRSEPLERPVIEIPDKSSRKVKTKILPIPRCDVNQLLALEAPEGTARSGSSRDPTHKGAADALPPILSPAAETPDPLPPILSPESQEKDDPAATFFMTQVDEKPVMNSSQHEINREKKKPAKEVTGCDSKYKGYEILLDIEESATEDNLPLSKDLSTNFRALQYALNHPLVFRDQPSDLEKHQPPFRPYVKNKLPSNNKCVKSKSEQLEEALNHLKSRSAVMDMELKTVLAGQIKQKRQSTEANKLLGEVQRRYNAVRATSMNDAHQLHRKKQEVIQDLKKIHKPVL